MRFNPLQPGVAFLYPHWMPCLNLGFFVERTRTEESLETIAMCSVFKFTVPNTSIFFVLYNVHVALNSKLTRGIFQTLSNIYDRAFL